MSNDRGLVAAHHPVDNVAMGNQLNGENSPRYPGPRSRAMMDEMARYVRYEPWPFVIDTQAGEGMYLATVDGQKLFDWAGYYASKLVAHNHPRLKESAYVRRLVDAANNKVANPDFLTPQCLDYYRLVHSLAPASMRSAELEFYAVNSGAEAVENMLKYLVSLYNRRRGPGKSPARRFIYFEKAFHGRTIYTLNVTQTQDLVATRDFHGLVASGNYALTFPEVDNDLGTAENQARVDSSLDQVKALLDRAGDEIVGIIVEPLQGAGGHRVALANFFRGLSTLAQQYDSYLAFDEVQTSAGPTGKVFAMEHFDLPYPPQAIAVGKKFALGGVYMLQTLPDLGVLDSTWGGNLADMVRFVQEWRIVEDEKLVQRAVTTGERLNEGLRELQKKYPDQVRNVRGIGLFQGFSLRKPADRNRLMDYSLQKQDLLLLGAGDDSIRFRPNLSVTEMDVERLMELLDRGLGQL